MAGGGARRAEHRVAFVAAIHLPVAVEMLCHPPALGAGMAVDDQIGDPFRHRQVIAAARGLERRHQRLGQVHVGVLAPVWAKGGPVCGIFLGGSTRRVIPEPAQQHIGDIGHQTSRPRMPHHHR